MKLRQKYALVKLDGLGKEEIEAIENFFLSKFSHPVLEFGGTAEGGFFVIKLRDHFASDALRAYACAVMEYCEEHLEDYSTAWQDWKDYAEEVDALADRAGIHHPTCKLPD